MPLAALPLASLPPFAPGQAPAARQAALPPAPYGGPVVRVLLRQQASLTLGAEGGVARLTDATGRTVAELAPGERLTLQGDPEGSAMALARPGEAASPVPVAELWLTPRRDGGSQGVVLLDGQLFRGRLQLSRQGQNLQAINHVSLESYLAGVVGSEMPASWPLDALRAQAVAARTYALAQRRPAAPYDVKATVASQVYRGVSAETTSTREAVASTRSQVLMHGGALINAVFHSSSGGITENSGDLWTRQLPYLVSVPDFDDSSPVSQWQVRIEPDKLLKAFPETGGVRRLEVLGTTGSGRVRQARVTGPSGSLVLSGAELRTRLGLRSTLVQFELLQPEIASLPVSPPPSPLGAPAAGSEAPPLMPAVPLLPLQVPQPALLVTGRGFGHGVGLSQWGAFAMARQGSSYDQILRHYYRGAEVRPLPN